MIYKFQPELDSLDTLKLWGFSKAVDIIKVENLRKKRSDSDFKYDKNDPKNSMLTTLAATFRKDLEIFVAILDPCTRFIKTANLAPRFFNIIFMFFGRTFLISYLVRLCSFVTYEKKRQNLYLPLQIKVLDRNLALAGQVLDFFDKREDKPELYFSVKELFDRLTITSNAYNKLNFKKNEDPRIVYSTLRCIVIDYSDIIKLIVLRLELDRYRRIAR